MAVDVYVCAFTASTDALCISSEFFSPANPNETLAKLLKGAFKRKRKMKTKRKAHTALITVTFLFFSCLLILYTDLKLTEKVRKKTKKKGSKVTFSAAETNFPKEIDK